MNSLATATLGLMHAAIGMLAWAILGVPFIQYHLPFFAIFRSGKILPHPLVLGMKYGVFNTEFPHNGPYTRLSINLLCQAKMLEDRIPLLK